jgi:hypothetical protein
MYKILPKKTLSIFITLTIAMLGGRIVYGIVNLILLSLNNRGYTFEVYVTSVYIDAIPGLILQFILIPAIMVALENYQRGTHVISRDS